MKLRLLVVTIMQIPGSVLKQKISEESPLSVKALVKEKYGQTEVFAKPFTDALNETDRTLKLHFITSPY